MPLPLTDALSYVHGTGPNANSSLSYTNGVLGDPICYFGSQYSNLELDLNAGLLSASEKGYSAPAARLGGTPSSPLRCKSS